MNKDNIFGRGIVTPKAECKIKMVCFFCTHIKRCMLKKAVDYRGSKSIYGNVYF